MSPDDIVTMMYVVMKQDNTSSIMCTLSKNARVNAGDVLFFIWLQGPATP